jgi:hypothetical protein
VRRKFAEFINLKILIVPLSGYSCSSEATVARLFFSSLRINFSHSLLATSDTQKKADAITSQARRDGARVQGRARLVGTSWKATRKRDEHKWRGEVRSTALHRAQDGQDGRRAGGWAGTWEGRGGAMAKLTL